MENNFPQKTAEELDQAKSCDQQEDFGQLADCGLIFLPIPKMDPDEQRIRDFRTERLLDLVDIMSCSLQRAKEKILVFKQTREPKLFSLLLARFDRFVIYVCGRFKREFDFLWDIPIQDLYHTAIIAVYKSFISMPDTWKLELLLQRIKSYIKQEFFTWFKDKVALKSCELENYDLECDQSKAVLDFQNKIDASLILDSLAEEDRTLLVKKVMEDRTYEELRQEYGGISKQALSKRVKKILKKCRGMVDK